GGGATFDNITAGVEAALSLDIPVNLRVILDRENMKELPELARFAAARGWTKHSAFKTQLGRAYELHTCLPGAEKLYSRLAFFQALAREIEKEPGILEFHRPAFSVARFLFENERLPAPLFDSCPGTKTEWAFDGAGRIYSCTATVGKEGEELGTFHPVIAKDNDRIARWQERDVTAVAACRDCPLQLACGGGCAAVARHTAGDILTPDCRPVDKLLELGLPLYLTPDYLEVSHV
ncbi:MAG TPA: SPASM domain-containing protein, partial [Spirochaetia bacterium]|nr:SPASM domain-containing protein [Spirochaetia bacterium]